MNSLEIWDKYKSLEMWKRVLLIVPALVAVALAAVWVFFRPENMGLIEELFEEKQKETEEVVETAEENIKEAEKKIEQLRKEREELKDEVMKNEKTRDDIDDRIDSADSLDELERIRLEIAEQQGKPS